MVVLVTVGKSLSLKEACGAQLHFTLHTHKVLRVPNLPERCDHLQNRKNTSDKTTKWFNL